METEIEKKQFEEIEKLIFKFDYDVFGEEIFYYVSYNYESKNIKTLKYLVEQSKRLQWWDHDGYSKYTKKTIVININPHKTNHFVIAPP